MKDTQEAAFCHPCPHGKFFLDFGVRLLYSKEIMAGHLLIDGYNLMGACRELYGPDSPDLEQARERLIKRLARYRGLKGLSITLVFDGNKGGFPTRHRERRRGMEIIFSRLGEEADFVIKDLVAKAAKSYVVITSDNDILNFAERKGCVFMRSGEFDRKMQMADAMSEKGVMGADVEMREPRISTKKKGNPRRLSKKDRKRRAALRKI